MNIFRRRYREYSEEQIVIMRSRLRLFTSRINHKTKAGAIDHFVDEFIKSEKTSIKYKGHKIICSYNFDHEFIRRFIANFYIYDYMEKYPKFLHDLEVFLVDRVYINQDYITAIGNNRPKEHHYIKNLEIRDAKEYIGEYEEIRIANSLSLLITSRLNISFERISNQTASSKLYFRITLTVPPYGEEREALKEELKYVKILEGRFGLIGEKFSGSIESLSGQKDYIFRGIFVDGEKSHQRKEIFACLESEDMAVSHDIRLSESASLDHSKLKIAQSLMDELCVNEFKNIENSRSLRYSGVAVNKHGGATIDIVMGEDTKINIAMIEAAKTDDFKNFLIAIVRGADLNFQEPDTGDTALHCIARNVSTYCLDILESADNIVESDPAMFAMIEFSDPHDAKIKIDAARRTLNPLIRNNDHDLADDMQFIINPPRDPRIPATEYERAIDRFVLKIAGLSRRYANSIGIARYQLFRGSLMDPEEYIAADNAQRHDPSFGMD